MAMALEDAGRRGHQLHGRADRHGHRRRPHQGPHQEHRRARGFTSSWTQGEVVIVAGFQGVTEDGDVTTLGRGGSNVTLVAIAAALKADVCENYTDVDGIYTADPRIVPNARKIDDDQLRRDAGAGQPRRQRAAQPGGGVRQEVQRAHPRAQQPATHRKGTMIVAETQDMERIVVSGAALKDKLARVTLKSVPEPARRGRQDLPHHRHAQHRRGRHHPDHRRRPRRPPSPSPWTWATWTTPKAVAEALQGARRCQAVFEDHLAKVSVVGVGMRVHTGVAERMFAALAEAGHQHPEHHHQRDQDLLPHQPRPGQGGPAAGPRRLRTGRQARPEIVPHQG